MMSVTRINQTLDKMGRPMVVLGCYEEGIRNALAGMEQFGVFPLQLDLTVDEVKF